MKRLPAQKHLIARMRHAEHAGGDFFDKVRVRLIRAQQRDIALQHRAHSFEAGDFLVQDARPFNQPFSSLETVLARDRVMDEVGHQCQTAKQNHGKLS